MKRIDNASVLRWREIDYQPSYKALKSRHSDAEIRAEYARLRKIANKRLDALSRSEFADTQMYRNHADGFPTLRELRGDNTALAYELNKLSRFIAAKTGSVTGMRNARREAIESLHARGYDFINKKNFADFGRFMETVRNRLKGRMYDSERAVELFRTAEQKQIPAETLKSEFEFFLENEKQLSRIEPTEAQKKSTKRLMTAINKQKKKEAKAYYTYSAPFRRGNLMKEGK